MPERRDGDRIIVTGYSSGSHFPREQKLMQYSWEANGSSKTAFWRRQRPQKE